MDVLSYATVKRNSSGKYFVAIYTEVEIQPPEKADSTIGIDLGITECAILSDGHKIDNKIISLLPKWRRS